VSSAVWELAIGLPILFFVPGYTLTKALFPEWRVRGETALQRALEIAVLAFVLSVVLTVLVGWTLLSVAPGGFQAEWSDPLLQTILAGIALVGFVAGWVRGAYAHDPPVRVVPTEDVGEEGAWELTRRLEELAREQRRLEHRLRVSSADGEERVSLQQDIDRLRREQESLGRQREAAYGR
jgi:uncharacterized membrane protein